MSKTKKRKYKGKSLIDFPQEYCIVDLETTGFSPNYDSIIEIGAIKYKNNMIVDKFDTLVQLESEDDFIPNCIQNINNITDEMLENSGEIPINAISKFNDFIGQSIIVGHNANFDINFLYDAYQKYLKKPMTNNFVDTLRIFRKLYPDLKHHRLKDLCSLYNLINIDEHRSIGDCRVTGDGFQKLYKEVLEKYKTVENFRKAFNSKARTINRKAIREAESVIKDPESPIYQKFCVITGKLSKFECKEDAYGIINGIGGFSEKM